MAITFRTGIGTTKKATISGASFDAFEIEYEAPHSAAMLEADSKVSREGIGIGALWLTAKFLRSWSLAQELGATQEAREKTLAALDPAEVLLSLYLQLREDGRESLKN
jgi:hypothetical protein